MDIVLATGQSTSAEKGENVVTKIVDDISRSLENECYLAALALALTLPDICGKAEYPHEESSKKRYIQWYDDNIGITEKPPKAAKSDTEMPYLSGEVVYSLRCQFLHQGTPTIETKKIKEEACQIDEFTLLIQKKTSLDLYSDSAAVFSCGTDPDGKKPTHQLRSYEVNVRRLCMILCACAEGYYKENADKFNFFQYEIVDADEREEQFLSEHPEARDFNWGNALMETIKDMEA